MIKLNRKITIRSWTTTRNAIGGLVASQVGNWPIWAQVKDNFSSRNADINYDHAQQKWMKTYEITFRYAASREIGSNYTIDYDGKLLKITSLSNTNEARLDYVVARCVGIDSKILPEGSGTMIPLPGIGEYYYTASTVTDTFTAAVLIGKSLFGVFKDGVKYDKVTTFTTGKQYIFNAGTGQITFSHSFDVDETASVQYYS